MNIFISAIDTQLGYHLTESLRQDHLFLNHFSIITGTITHQNNSFLLHDSISQTFDFHHQRDITVKHAINSDVIIFDLRYHPSTEIQFLLKLLKHYTLQKPLKMIAISNFTTWSNSKQTQFIDHHHLDKQTLLQHTINKAHWKHTQLNKAHYSLRTPHPMFVYNYLLQEQILQLKNINKMIEPVILCTGLLYGKSGFDLRMHVENAVRGKEDWLIQLKNTKNLYQDNVLPILHVNKLMEEVQRIVYSKNNSTEPKIQEYKVLCQENPKSIFKILETLNELCGNNKQPIFHKQDFIKQEKSPTNILKIPSGFSQNQQSNQTTLDIASPRTPVVSGSIIRNSTTQHQLVTQPLTNSFVPELAFAKDKFKFSLVMNIRFGTNDQSSEKKIVKRDSKQVNRRRKSQQVNTQQSQGNAQENISFSEKHWLQAVIQQFIEYYDCDFRHFLLSEQLFKEQQTSTQKLPATFTSRYRMIDRNIMIQELNYLIENGVIPQERLTTPEDEKKKLNNNKNQNRQSAMKQPYEMVFNEIIPHVLRKYKLTHFIVCLKAQLIGKMLGLISQPGFQDLKDINFMSLVAKEPNPSTPIYQVNESITKCIQLMSDEFYEIYDIQNPQKRQKGQEQRNQVEQDEIKKSVIKSRRNMQSRDDNDEEEGQPKINLLQQYLLDNVVVYLAQAKQNLRAKGKLILGQRFEGKEKIMQFIEELKEIRARQMKLACDEQQ